MECLLTFVILVAIFVVMTALAARAQSRADRRNRAYQHVAERFNGVCVPGGWFGSPTVRMRYGATQAILSTGIIRGPQTRSLTQLLIQWSAAEHHLEILPRTADGAGAAFQRGQEVRTAADAFHTEFLCVSTQPAHARRLLSEGVQWQIEQLAHVAEGADVHVTISRSRLTIRVMALLRRFDELEQFTQLALGLYDQAMLTQTVGIQFLAGAAAQPGDAPAKCQICGEAIHDHPVLCRRCKTPHHLDCWQYYGACATYGCKESRYFTPPALDGDPTRRTGAEGR